MKFNCGLILSIIALFGVTARSDITALPRAKPGVIHLRYVNALQSAISSTVVPRNTAGNPGDTVGSIGVSAFRWNIFHGATIALQGDPVPDQPTFIRPASTGQTVDMPIRLPLSLPPGESRLLIDPQGNLQYGGAYFGNYTTAPASSGDFTGTSQVDGVTLFGDLITNQSVSLITSGNPIRISLQAGGTTLVGYGWGKESGSVSIGTGSGGAGVGHILFMVDGVMQPRMMAYFDDGTVPNGQPCSNYSMLVQVPAGSHYVEARAGLGQTSVGTPNVTDCRLVVYEVF